MTDLKIYKTRLSFMIIATSTQDISLKLLNFGVEIFCTLLLYELVNYCEVHEVLSNLNQLDFGVTLEGQPLEPKNVVNGVMVF